VRRLARLVAIALLLPAALALVFATTRSGVAYALGWVGVLAGCGLLGQPAARPLAGTGAALLAVTLVARVVAADRGTTLVMHAGADSGPRLVDRVVDEADLSVAAARLLGLTSFGSDPDAPVLPQEMTAAYARMRAEQGTAPSPVVATYLGLQEPSAYDLIEIGDIEQAPGVVVFLHGFTGSFALPCWEISRAAAQAGMATVCPSTRWVGDWWSPAGEATLRDVVARLRERRQTRLVLAGLSNGGIGGSLLLARLPGVFQGFLAISGASPEATPPGIPVLCVQGRRDRNIPPSIARAYAARTGGKYVELDAGHFALLMKEDLAVDAIASWLRELRR
jgi:pimeloyl-ACP methyl ester carboxylesterase